MRPGLSCSRPGHVVRFGDCFPTGLPFLLRGTEFGFQFLQAIYQPRKIIDVAQFPAGAISPLDSLNKPCALECSDVTLHLPGTDVNGHRKWLGPSAAPRREGVTGLNKAQGSGLHTVLRHSIAKGVHASHQGTDCTATATTAPSDSADLRLSLLQNSASSGVFVPGKSCRVGCWFDQTPLC